MPAFIDLKGQRFGRLVVMSLSKIGWWNCRCDCGKDHLTRSNSLRRGLTQSCGCLKDEKTAKRSLKHGFSEGARRERSPEYSAWKAAKARCSNSNRHNWRRYGGRGIRVCDEWINDFAAFYAFMGPRPSPEHSLDRYPDNDGNYEPGNVRWATAAEQARNKSTNHVLIIDDQRLCLTEASEKFGRHRRSISRRLDKGWDAKRAAGGA